MVLLFWNSYKNEKNYLLWFNIINEFFLYIEIYLFDIWNKVFVFYEEMYFVLI